MFLNLWNTRGFIVNSIWLLKSTIIIYHRLAPGQDLVVFLLSFSFLLLPRWFLSVNLWYGFPTHQVCIIFYSWILRIVALWPSMYTDSKFLLCSSIIHPLPVHTDSSCQRKFPWQPVSVCVLILAPLCKHSRITFVPIPCAKKAYPILFSIVSCLQQTISFLSSHTSWLQVAWSISSFKTVR